MIDQNSIFLSQLAQLIIKLSNFSVFLRRNSLNQFHNVFILGSNIFSQKLIFSNKSLSHFGLFCKLKNPTFNLFFNNPISSLQSFKNLCQFRIRSTYNLRFRIFFIKTLINKLRIKIGNELLLIPLVIIDIRNVFRNFAKNFIILLNIFNEVIKLLLYIPTFICNWSLFVLRTVVIVWLLLTLSIDTEVESVWPLRLKHLMFIFWNYRIKFIISILCLCFKNNT